MHRNILEGDLIKGKHIGCYIEVICVYTLSVRLTLAIMLSVLCNLCL